MEKILDAIVIEENGSKAKVNILQHAECENCGTCASAGYTVLVENKAGAKAGDKVKVSMPEDKSLRPAFIIFFLPLAMVFAGVYSGKIFSGYFRLNETVSMIIVGIVFFIISGFIIILSEKKARADKKNTAEIIEIIS
jgi:sigma-E factor negative regulatory protein RseC